MVVLEIGKHPNAIDFKSFKLIVVHALNVNSILVHMNLGGINLTNDRNAGDSMRICRFSFVVVEVVFGPLDDYGAIDEFIFRKLSSEPNSEVVGFFLVLGKLVAKFNL